MRPSDNELVRVRSADELRAGMTVWTDFKGWHSQILSRPAKGGCPDHGDVDCSWRIVGGWKGYTKLCVSWCIARKCLYRIRDLDDSAEQETSKRREMEDA